MGQETHQETIPGFNLNTDVEDQEEDLIPDDILPKVSATLFPKKSEIPYIDDFDDAGLERFVQDEFDIARLDNLKKKGYD